MAYTPIYTRKNFVNNSAPAINATNLNDIEDALVSLENGLQTAAADTDTNTAAITTINGEISDLNNLIDEILPDDSESGNPAVISDAFAGECKSLVLTLEPIQSGSGTPSPANPRPITGRTQSTATRTGKNLLNPSNVTANLKYDFDATTGIYELLSGGVAIVSRYFFKANVTYTISATMISGSVKPCIIVRNIDGSTIGQKTNYTDVSQALSFTFTTDGERDILLQSYGNGTTQTVGSTFKLMLEVGSTATPYEPYDGESITRAYGQTIYKGSDVATGEGLTNNAKLTQLNGGFLSAVSGAFYLENVTDLQDVPSLCNLYPIGYEIQGAAGALDYPKTLCWQKNGLQQLRLCVYDPDYSSYNAFNAMLAQTPMQVIFDLATPASIPLTPQNLTLLKGDNVITTDADNVEVDYKADIALYIAKQLGGNLGNRGAKSAPAEEPADDPKEEKTADDTKEEEKTDEKIIEPVTKEAKK